MPRSASTYGSVSRSPLSFPSSSLRPLFRLLSSHVSHWKVSLGHTLWLWSVALSRSGPLMFVIKNFHTRNNRVVNVSFGLVSSSGQGQLGNTGNWNWTKLEIKSKREPYVNINSHLRPLQNNLCVCFVQCTVKLVFGNTCSTLFAVLSLNKRHLEIRIVNKVFFPLYLHNCLWSFCHKAKNWALDSRLSSVYMECVVQIASLLAEGYWFYVRNLLWDRGTYVLL